MIPPVLPAPLSWFPGHMSSFMRNLPTLLTRTDIILEMRDSRLPLTSVNPNFEEHLQTWKGKAKEVPNDDPASQLRRRIIVLSKKDLVPAWGLEVGDTGLYRNFGSTERKIAQLGHSISCKIIGATAHTHIRAIRLHAVTIECQRCERDSKIIELGSTRSTPPTSQLLVTVSKVLESNDAN